MASPNVGSAPSNIFFQRLVDMDMYFNNPETLMGDPTDSIISFDSESWCAEIKDMIRGCFRVYLTDTIIGLNFAVAILSNNLQCF